MTLVPHTLLIRAPHTIGCKWKRRRLGHFRGDRASNPIKSRLHDPKGPEASCEPALACGMLGKVDEDDEDTSGQMW